MIENQSHVSHVVLEALCSRHEAGLLPESWVVPSGGDSFTERDTCSIPDISPSLDHLEDNLSPLTDHGLHTGMDLMEAFINSKLNSQPDALKAILGILRYLRTED